MKELTLDNTAFQSDNINFRFLTLNDEDKVQQLLWECPNYLLMERGTLPEAGDAAAIMRDLPPGRDINDKVLISIESEMNCVGLLELIRDYPEKNIWWIGLLLIRPDFRNLSLGNRVIHMLEKQLFDGGVNEIRLGVLEENIAGARFWKRIGFVEIDSKPGRVFGMKTHTVIVMGKQLTSAKLLKENF